MLFLAEEGSQEENGPRSVGPSEVITDQKEATVQFCRTDSRLTRYIFLPDVGQHTHFVPAFPLQQWRGSSAAQWRGMFSAGYMLFLMCGLGVCQEKCCEALVTKIGR